jgi:hypothetical protein
MISAMKDLQRSNSLRFLGFFSFCVIATLALIGCDGFTHINDIVKDRGGAPVPNVDVVLATGERSDHALSSSDGKFNVGMVHAPTNVKLTLSLTRDGYAPYHKAFQSHDHLTSLDITLQPLPEPTLGQVRKLRLKGLNAFESRELAELMCQQLPNAAAFPMKSFLSGDDVHDTLVLLNGFAQSCLVDHLTDFNLDARFTL